MPNKPYYKYNLNLGSTVGDITIRYDGNPGGVNAKAIPVKFKVTWNGTSYTNGFKGDGSYNSELIKKGFALATSYSIGTTDDLKFTKNLAVPSSAVLEIFLPIYNSLADFSVICPTATVAPTATPTATPPGWTPGPTATPEPTATPGPTATPPGPTATLAPPPPPPEDPEGPTEGLEVHIAFGTRGKSAGVAENEILFDDNYVMGDEHWVIDWYEINDQEELSAVLTNRKICCLWPSTTIATKILVLGSPSGMSFKSSFIQVESPQCGTCKWTEPMMFYSGTINASNFTSLEQFGGLYWNALVLIASLKQTILKDGYWTGPIGPGASYSPSSSLRIAGSANPTLEVVAAALGVHLGTPPTSGCCKDLDPYSSYPAQYDIVCGKLVPIQMPSGGTIGTDSCEKSYSKYLWCEACNSDGSPSLNKINTWTANKDSCSFEPAAGNTDTGSSCPNF